MGSFNGRQKAPRAINLGGDLLTLDFWPKIISSHLVMHLKVTITLWFAKKNPAEISVFSHFEVVLGSFWGRQGAPKATNLGGDLSTLIFWPKNISFHLVMHIKATKPQWFVKKPSSNQCP